MNNPGALTGNIWLDVLLALAGLALMSVGIAVLFGLRLPGQDRLPVPGGVLGALLLALGTALVGYYGQPDLVDKAVKALAGS